VAHGILVKHRGAIRAYHPQEGGGEVRFWLPASPEAVAEPAPAEPAGAAAVTGGRVLVMDDEEMIREVTRQLLRLGGFDAECVRDGQAAIDAFERARRDGHPHRAVIMDLTVPGGMGGAEAVKEILKIDPKARVIVASGYSSDTVMSDFRGHGFRGRLVKPFRSEDLLRELRQVLAEPE
jgi:CheY-like chemotaxis protein